MKKVIFIAVICILSLASLESNATIVIYANVNNPVTIMGHEQVILTPTSIQIFCHQPLDCPCILVVPSTSFPVNQGEVVYDGMTYPLEMTYTVDNSDVDNTVFSFPKIR